VALDTTNAIGTLEKEYFRFKLFLMLRQSIVGSEMSFKITGVR